MTARLSVVIPAHDEAALIARALVTLVSSDPDALLEIVVVANGCRDATAAIARAVSPRIRVVEIAPASKIAALNAGDAEATVFPRAYVDADVHVDATALLAVADALDAQSGRYAGAPTLRVDTTGASVLVRSYARIWALTDYRRSAPIGSGVYLLSAAGRARFDAFPDVVADDAFVMGLFAVEERYVPAHATFTVRAPRTFRSQIGRGARILAGNLQLSALRGTRAPAAPVAGLVRTVSRHPQLWPSFVVYCVGYALARRRALRLVARGGPLEWTRDETTRTPA